MGRRAKIAKKPLKVRGRLCWRRQCIAARILKLEDAINGSRWLEEGPRSEIGYKAATMTNSLRSWDFLSLQFQSVEIPHNYFYTTEFSKMLLEIAFNAHPMHYENTSQAPSVTISIINLFVP